MSAENKIHAFWNDSDHLKDVYNGAPPFGGGGVTEARFRAHEEARTFRRLVPLHKSDTLLEIGCGAGRWALALADRVKSYVGVDFSRSLIEEARAICAACGLANVKFVEVSAEAYQPGQKFSVIYYSGITQYLEDDTIHRMLEREENFLAEGGVLVDRSTFHRRQRTTREDGDYFSIYRTHAELIEIFRQHGYEAQQSAVSYSHFCFSNKMSNSLGKPARAAFIARNQFWTYPLLRAAARLGSRFREPPGDMDIHEHLITVFRRGPEARRSAV